MSQWGRGSEEAKLEAPPPSQAENTNADAYQALAIGHFGVLYMDYHN